MCTRNQAFEILKIVYHACDPILGHSIHDAILYGSYARGDFTAESDIDILLTADLTQDQIASQRRAVSGVASTLSLDHDITVSVHVVPLAQFRRYADFLPFYQNVLKEGIRYAGRGRFSPDPNRDPDWAKTRWTQKKNSRNFFI